MIYLVIFLSLVAIAELVALLWLHTSVYEGEVNGHPFVFHPLKKKEVGQPLPSKDRSILEHFS